MFATYSTGKARVIKAEVLSKKKEVQISEIGSRRCQKKIKKPY